jgi:hypothetical protein
MDSVQSTMSRLNNAISVGDIDGKVCFQFFFWRYLSGFDSYVSFVVLTPRFIIYFQIRNMEHMIQHETLPLKEEKQLIRQIKQLKQSRGELSTIIAKQDQSQSLDDNESIEEQTKVIELGCFLFFYFLNLQN